jgi:hypothetical protein
LEADQEKHATERDTLSYSSDLLSLRLRLNSAEARQAKELLAKVTLVAVKSVPERGSVGSA